MATEHGHRGAAEGGRKSRSEGIVLRHIRGCCSTAGRPLLVQPGLPGSGVVGPRAQDDPQDVPVAGRGARMAAGKPGRASQGNAPRSLPYDPKRNRGSVAHRGRGRPRPNALR